MKTTKITSLLTAFAMFAGTAAMVPVMPESEIVASAVESTEAAYDNQTEMEEPTGDWCETEPADEYEDPTSNCIEYGTEVYEEPTGDCCETEPADEYEDPTGNCEQEGEEELLQIGELWYYVYDDYATVAGCEKNAEEVDISAEIEGLPVTDIDPYAFEGCMKLTKVTIPDGVTCIGEYAFYGCERLADITFPENLMLFYKHAFNGTAWLTEKLAENPMVVVNGVLIEGKTCEGDIVIPDDVTRISYSAFSGCETLKSVTIPDTIEEIQEYAFKGCIGLTSIEIPSSVTEIRSGTFEACTALESVTIPDSVKEIDYRAFESCTALTDVYFSGTKVEWDEISFYDYGNEALLNAEIHYASDNKPAVIPGNLNGDTSIDATDAALLLSAAAAAGAGGESGLTAEQIAAADLDGNGSFDASDASLILMYAAYSGAGGELGITEFLAQM